MKKWHVTYFYLATGMEGIADEKDYGIIEADTKEDAFEYIVNNLDTARQEYSDKIYRYWGLQAKEVLNEKNEKNELEWTTKWPSKEGIYAYNIKEYHETSKFSLVGVFKDSNGMLMLSFLSKDIRFPLEECKEAFGGLTVQFYGPWKVPSIPKL